MYYLYLSKFVFLNKCVNVLKYIVLFDFEFVWSFFFYIIYLKIYEIYFLDMRILYINNDYE